MQKLSQLAVKLNYKRSSSKGGNTLEWLLLLIIFTGNPTIASAQEPHAHWPDRERIDQVVNAINVGNIRYKGKVSSIDPEIEKKHTNHTKSWSEAIRITKGDQQANHSWDFYFDSNDRGQILRYSLSNSSWKAAPHQSSWEAADFIDSNKMEFSRRFGSALTEKDKLRVCIDAMNDGFIFVQMPVKALQDFLGQSYVTEKLKNGGKVYYYPFSTTRDCWRLYFFKQNEEVSEYFITNQPNYFKGKPQHEWWERHAKRQEDSEVDAGN